MGELDLRLLDDDSFIVSFGGEASEIDVYTLSEALTGLADALQAINAIVNPGVEFEVIVEATGEGSFRAFLKSKKRRNAFLLRTMEAIVLGLLINYLYDHWSYEKPTYRVEGDQLIVETSRETIIFPKAVFDHQDQVARSPTVAKGVKQAIEAVQQDEAVSSLGLIPDASSPRPAIDIPRQDFNVVLSRVDQSLKSPYPLALEDGALTPRSRTIVERTQLVIVKAVLRRSRRKWEFNWNGFPVSAPITDPTFFDRLESRQIAISQGDSLDVDLTISQTYDEEGRYWLNTDFEVTKVYDLLPGVRQTMLGL